MFRDLAAPRVETGGTTLCCWQCLRKTHLKKMVEMAAEAIMYSYLQ
jgi:hypothetical protein